MKYTRALLKISGESLAGSGKFGLDFKTVRNFGQELAELSQDGAELGIVIGGGNIFRGRNIPKDSINRSTADYMGMIGTIINALALQAEIEQFGVECRVMSALSVKEVAEDYIRRRAMTHLERGRIVIFAAGSGNPYFTTDTAAALRALEIDAQIILKATPGVDGIYTSDPNGKNKKKSKMLKKVSYHGALTKRLQVMDSTAFSLCRDNNMPIVVFKQKKGMIKKVLNGEDVGTWVGN